MGKLKTTVATRVQINDFKTEEEEEEKERKPQLGKEEEDEESQSLTQLEVWES